MQEKSNISLLNIYALLGMIIAFLSLLGLLITLMLDLTQGTLLCMIGLIFGTIGVWINGPVTWLSDEA